MGNYTEKEIKILNVVPEIIEKKLIELGAKKDFDTIQNIATYQYPTTKTRYLFLLEQLKEPKIDYSTLKQKFCNFFNEMNNVVNGDNLIEICGYKDLSLLADNLNLDNKVLTSEKFINYIGNLNNRFFKWIRLRSSNGKTTLTIKEIFSQDDDYPIDKLKEVEFEVSDFNAANKFLTELDFYCDSHQEKRRIQYKYKNTEIVIDFWPMIPPYIEIEGEDRNDIYELVKQLGYKEEDARVINTDTVYLENGINREDYLILTFNEQIKK